MKFANGKENSQVHNETQIRYVDGSCRLDLRIIHSWDRGEIVPISGGSGLKDYVKNAVWSIFEAHHDLDQVLVVRANGHLFYLVRAGANWFDSIGKQVLITQGGQPCKP
jgi:hypothetical protein